MSTNILKAMRRGAITMALIAIGAITAHSQNQVITVDIQNVPLGKAMEIISQKAGMKVAYSKEFVDTDKIVSVKSTGETLDKVLSQMLGKIGVAYDYQNNSILLYKKGQNATGSGSNNATDGNSFDVSGVVTDIQGEPIIGATVAIVGTNRGMATDLDGQFSLRVKKGDKLRISYEDTQSKTLQ
ncbi:MAG: carboxypeptidase-like regulatory domain-containing protein [Muribaculaceae bacterium]